MKRIIALFGILIIAFVACDKKATDPTDPVIELPVNNSCFEAGSSCEIQPLSVGAKWVTERIYYDSDGAEKNRDTVIQIIEKDTVVDGVTWFRDSPVWFTNTDSGLYYTYNSRDTSILYKYPTQVGDTYSCVSCSFVNKVISIDTTVATLLGSFRCYEYLTNYEWGDSTFAYVAPGVGPILSKTYLRSSVDSFYLGMKERLIEYSFPD